MPEHVPGYGFGLGEDTRLLVNLPPSHVGGQAEALMTTLFWGGTAVSWPCSTRQVACGRRGHRVNVIGQIPAMFNLRVALADYGGYDLSTPEVAIYGGQQVPPAFLERLSQMAPSFGTGLGLTESAGFCTYSTLAGTVDEFSPASGWDMPVYPMTIRGPMREDGLAGESCSRGETGNVCFHRPADNPGIC